MALTIQQDFYRNNLTQDIPTGICNIYVGIKPVPTAGWIVISPGSTISREIIKYTNTGTDTNGDYIVCSSAGDRGLGGTTNQIHYFGEPVRINITAENFKEISDALDSIVAGGAVSGTNTVMGIVKGASETNLGSVEEATDAEVTAGTATGSTGAKLFITPAKLHTYLPTVDIYKSGTTTKNAADASTTQTIAHGLGKIPKYVKIKALLSVASGTGMNGDYWITTLEANAVYNGTTQSSISTYYAYNTGTSNAFYLSNNNGGLTSGVITFDSTNISIVWTKTGSPTGTYQILWEAIG